jgi:hypothetical protein
MGHAERGGPNRFLDVASQHQPLRARQASTVAEAISALPSATLENAQTGEGRAGEVRGEALLVRHPDHVVGHAVGDA